MWFRKPSKNSKPIAKPQDEKTPLIHSGVIDKLKHTEDLKERHITAVGQDYVIIYIQTLVDQEKLEMAVIEPLTKSKWTNWQKKIDTN
ncbi:hypothetical protein GCM10009865_27020 [Aeromicrobium ponti]|uniref:GerA spore germination protein n=1 Tax=Cytobacillus oceanisediminis TaxID=665099 RepID=A0A562JTV4_9BACI|nr:spore germination protein [Cytobacillus oceanisediminis]TWH86596.1 GerA spore germination protein [Cytobacillus oceanisediminis]